MRRILLGESVRALLAVVAGAGVLFGFELRGHPKLSAFDVALEIVGVALIVAGVTRLLRKTPRFATFLGAFSLPIAVLFAIGIIVPVRLDTSVSTEYWMTVALHEAFLRGAHFGSEVVFTFGPWGFVMLGFHPKTVVLMFLLRLAIVVVGVLALWKSVEPISGQRGVAVILIATLAIVVHICWADTFFHLVPLLLLFMGFASGDDRKLPVYDFLLVAGGLLSLAKFSIMVMMTVAVVALTLEELRRRARPWTAACYAGAVAVFWLLARQRPTDFFAFLRTSLELAAGYGEAMARDPAAYSPHTLAPFMTAAISFTIILAAFELRGSKVRGVLFLGGWAALLLLLFKSAFVRADHFHVAPACGALLLIQLTYLAIRRRSGDRIAPVFLIIPIALSVYLVELYGEGGVVRDLSAAARTSADSIVRMLRWPAYRDEMNRIHQAAIAVTPVLRSELRGDFYPIPSGIMARKGFTYLPRPVFVSYAAYTPKLAEINAEWLRDTLPPAVLFDVFAIDKRLPSLQDGPSWPILLTRYRIAGRLGTDVLLERRPMPSGATLRPIATRRARFGEKVIVPGETDDALFARLAIDVTWTARIEGVLYKLPPLRIRVGLQDGTEKPYRLIRRMAEREFLLSPLVDDRDDFASLFERGYAHRRRVEWIIVDTERPSDARAYQPSYGIELLGLSDRP